MRIVQTIKPQIYEAYSKEELIRKIGLFGWTIRASKNYSLHGWTTMDQKFKFGVNFQKFNRKSKILMTGKRKVIREKKWIAYVYKFPIDHPISIDQKTRYFDFHF